METAYVEIGRILKPCGLRGRVKVHSYAASAARFSTGQEVFLRQGQGLRPLIVSEAAGSGKALLLRFEGRDNRQAVEPLAGSPIYVKREELKRLPEGEFYQIELIGSRVFGEEGRCLGLLEAVFSTPAHDIWVVRSGLKEILIPAVEAYIASVKPDRKEIRLKATHGLDQINDL
jgi:16S rRNA processing protein RimM